MGQLAYLTETDQIQDLLALRQKLWEDPEVVKPMTRQQMEDHMVLRAAKIESEVIRRYRGNNIKLRDERYRQMLDAEFQPKIRVWTAENERIKRERAARRLVRELE